MAIVVNLKGHSTGRSQESAATILPSHITHPDAPVFALSLKPCALAAQSQTLRYTGIAVYTNEVANGPDEPFTRVGLNTMNFRLQHAERLQSVVKGGNDFLYGIKPLLGLDRLKEST